GEFLQVAEFQAEQSYHMDRRRRHDRLLHVAGVAEGLDVTLVDPATVNVAAGTAVDDLGQQILLAADTKVTVPSGLNGNFSVVIAFVEQADTPDGTGANVSMKRQTQYPNVTIMTSAIAHAVVLGTVSIVSGKVTTVAPDGRVYSGVSLPGLPSGTGYLRA